MFPTENGINATHNLLTRHSDISAGMAGNCSRKFLVVSSKLFNKISLKNTKINCPKLELPLPIGVLAKSSPIILD